MDKALFKEKMSNVKWKHFTNYAIIIVAVMVVLICDQSGIMTRQFRLNLNTIAINIILAVSLNLLVGHLGLLTLGHAGFMCIGAFVGGVISIQLNSIGMSVFLRLPIAMVSGGLIAAVLSVVIGIPVMKLRGDYIAIVTLAFGEIIQVIIRNIDFLGGPIGLQGIPQDLKSAIGDPRYLISFAVVLITLFVIQNFIHSKHGRALQAIRDNEISARASGINITKYKMIAFVLAAFFAGVAGVLFSHSQSTIVSTSLDFNRSIEILLIVVLGGIGSITGTIISATAITLLPTWLENIGLGKYRLLVYAVILIAAMLFSSSKGGKFIKSKIIFYSKLAYHKTLLFVKGLFTKKERATNGAALETQSIEITKTSVEVIIEAEDTGKAENIVENLSETEKSDKEKKPKGDK